MAEIIKCYRENMPALRLIGKRYLDSDRDAYGSYGSKWDEWHQNGYFAPLEAMDSLPENDDAYVGCMRCRDAFEYWIGMFFPENTPVPEGYSHVDIPAGDVGVCWIYGKLETGELFGMEAHNACVQKMQDQSWKPGENGWFFERYNCPRFTKPDDKGNVILDYGMYLEGK